jgi:hypothetical protein
MLDVEPSPAVFLVVAARGLLEQPLRARNVRVGLAEVVLEQVVLG